MDFEILNKVILLNARRNSGKSVLLRKLVLDSKHHFSQIFCICPSESVNGFFKKSGIVKEKFIFETYTEKFGNALLKKLTELNKDKTKETASHTLLILDDCIADIDMRNSPSLKKIFVRGRHLFLSLICTSQNLKSLSPLERGNCDYILCGNLTANNLEILIEDFCPSSITKKEFSNYYSTATKNYGFIVINNNSTKTSDKDEILGVLRCDLEDV
jgi:hypothetical protein